MCFKTFLIVIGFTVSTTTLACTGQATLFETNNNGSGVKFSTVDERVNALISGLRAEDKVSRKKAQEKIVELSNSDPAFRSAAIPSLLNIVNSQDGPIIDCGPQCYQEWKLSVDTLGQIKAIEAVDSLVARIRVNNGVYGLSLIWFPAANALVKIGEPAVTRLEQTIQDSNDELQHQLCIQTLRSLRTESAKEALVRVQATGKQ